VLGVVGVARVAALFLACLCALACQAIVGDFEVVEGDQECDANRYRCTGELLLCVRTANGKEETTLIETCNSAAECDSAKGQCTVCKEGEFRCNGARLEKCSSNRTSWDLYRQCANAAECNVSSAECRACVPGETQCSGAEQRALQVCNANHTWSSAQTCETKELCELSAAAAPDANGAKACIPPGCPEPGVSPDGVHYRCVNGVELERCPPGRVAWVQTDVCASEDLCTTTANDPAGADANGTQCVEPECEPDEFRCNGNRLEQCNQDLQGWGLFDECMPPFVCDLNEQACSGPCTPGENQCNGEVLEVCNDRQEWEAFQTCASAALCVVTEDGNGLFYGACNDMVCPVALAYRCIDEAGETRLEQCREDFTGWEPVDVCLSPELCNQTNGVCDPPGCEPAGGYRCSPTQRLELQYCPASQLAWETDRVCESTQSCDAAGDPPGCSATCPAVSVMCVGNIRQVCSGETGVPVWSPEQTCPTADLCQCALDPDDGNACLGGLDSSERCGAPACGGTLPNTRCSGDFLETCDAGRNRWNQTDCTIECIEPSSGASYCAQCRTNEAQCAGTSIRACNATTKLYNPTTPCSLGCVDNSGSNDYCADCTDGSAECQGGDLRRCNDATQKWNDPEDCEHGCMTVSGPDYCAECDAGDAECVTGGLRTCDPMTRRWTAPVACALDCRTVSGADYCAVCSAGDAECMDDDLRTCDETTGRWNTPSPCSVACQEVSGADYCAECTAPDAECVTGGLQTCDMDTRLWSDPSPCPVTCFEAATGPDYCGDCTPGSSECPADDMRRTCSDEALWEDAEMCDFGCFDTGSSTYCGECALPEDCPSANCVLGLCEDP
jgi:hypothetical protein